jgi:hypothetical protein
VGKNNENVETVKNKKQVNINPTQIREDQPAYLQLQVDATTSLNNIDACMQLAVASHDDTTHE